MSFIITLLTPYVDKDAAAFSDATTQDLAIATVAVFAVLYVLSFFFFPIVVSCTAVGIAYSYWVAPAPAVISTLAIVAGYCFYAWQVFHQWEDAFAGHRLTRGNEASPSHMKMPDIRSMETNKNDILDNARFHKNFDDCKLLHAVADLKVNKKKNEVFRKRASTTGYLTPARAALSEERAEENKRISLGKEKAKELDMDHLFVKFSDFLWGFTFIGPFSYLLWLRGTTVLRFRKFLKKMGLINPRCDYEKLAATLVLEQTQAIHYYGRLKMDGMNIAGFFFADFPYVDDNCDFQIANLLGVDIDLDTKRFVKAKLDDEILTAEETVTLLWFNTIAAQHVKLHAMANWGVNLDDSLIGFNDFLRQNSVVTAMYNFFGYSSFSGFLKIWAKQGLLSDGWAEPKAPLIKCFNRGIKSNVWQHENIQQLANYSRFIKFVTKVRAIFIYEFSLHKESFPGVNGEAMFVGTILHSLDHTMMDWNLKDALYLDTSENNRFRKMAEIGQVVKVGFVSDVDGLYFHKRFKNSGHPFYDAVYKKAAKIDKLLADRMDTCIVK